MRRLGTGILLLILAGFSGNLPAQQPIPAPALPSIELPAALDRVLRDYERAWQARDAAALSALFAEDGFVLALRRGRGGRWLIAADIDNSSRPPRPTPTLTAPAK
jgi:hypothetical protein